MTLYIIMSINVLHTFQKWALWVKILHRFTILYPTVLIAATIPILPICDYERKKLQQINREKQFANFTIGFICLQTCKTLFRLLHEVPCGHLSRHYSSVFPRRAEALDSTSTTSIKIEETKSHINSRYLTLTRISCQKFYSIHYHAIQSHTSSVHNPSPTSQILRTRLTHSQNVLELFVRY